MNILSKLVSLLIAYCLLSTILFAQNTGGSNDGFTANAYCPGSLNGTPATLTLNSVKGYTNFCNNASEAFSVSSASGYPTYYYWTVPAKATILTGQGTTAISVAFGDTGGVVSVTAYNSCETVTKSMTVTLSSCNPSVTGGNNDGFTANAYCPGSLNGTPTALTLNSVTGYTNFCNNASEAYSISATNGYATYYYWTVPAKATILTGQGTTAISVAFGDTAGTVTVNAYNACETKTATKNITPTNCNASVPGGNNDGFTANSYCPGSLNGSPTALTLNSVVGYTNFCNNASEAYSISAASGYATYYYWTVPAKATILTGQGTTAATVAFGDTGGVVTVSAYNGCESVTKTTTVVTNNCNQSLSGGNNDGFTMSPYCSGNLNGSGASLKLNPISGFTTFTPYASYSYSISVAAGYATNYYWTISAGATILTGQGTNVITGALGASPGIIKVVATNACGVDSAILDLGCPVIADAGQDTTICKGGTATLTASGGISYKWNTGKAGDTIAIITVNPTTTTTYTVDVFDGKCSKSDAVVVNVTSLTGAAVVGNTTVCTGDSTTLTASGGTKYTWSTGASSSFIVYKPTKDTTLTVKIENSCSDTTISIPVTIFQSSSVKIQGDTSICLGNSTTLTASGGGTYLWNTAGATTATITVSPKQDTTYKVIITNGTCKDSAEITVKVNSQMVINAGNDATICTGESVQLGVSGDTTGATFSWAPSLGLNDNTLANPTANSQTNTTYIVMVINSKCTNATAVDSVTITVQSPPVTNAGIDKAICKGSDVQIGSVGIGGNTYLWSPKTGLGDSTIAQPTANPLTTTQYVLTVSNGKCANKDTVTVTVNPLPTITASANNSTLTRGDSTGLTASGAKDYTWTPITYLSNSTVANPVSKPEKTITYTITGTDNNGCVGTDTITVTITEKDSCGEVFVPNAFSPNGNVFNEVFRVRIAAECVKEIHLEIYDRWGNKVFETNDVIEATQKGWDGTFNGKAMGTGVFVYYAKITLANGNEELQKGNVSLIR